NEDKDNVKKIISNGIVVLFIGIILFCLLYFSFMSFLDIQYKYLILLIIILFVINHFLLLITRGLKKNVIYSISGIITTFIMLSCNIILIVIFDFRVRGLFISYALALSTSNIFVIYKIRLYKYINYNRYKVSIQKGLLQYSLPLIPTALSWWIMKLSDRWLLNYYLGLEANGIYAISNKFPALLMTINSIFYLAWQESALTGYNDDNRDEYYTEMFNMYMVFQFTSVLCLIAFTKLIMSLIISSDFYEAWRFTYFLYLGAVFFSFSSFYGTGYLSAKETKGSFITSIWGAIVNIAINILFIPIIGIQAASISTLASCLLMWILRERQTRAYFNIKINLKKFCILIFLILLFISVSYLEIIFLDYIVMIISVIVFVSFNYKLIKYILKIIKNKLGEL
ncbi:MAG: lipopolysaccharide biosynthesis protein, partial [archaeon]